MFKKKDPYTFSKFLTLNIGSTPIGSICLEYQVTHYDDVQVNYLDFVFLGQNVGRKFLVHCTQTVNLYNQSTNLGPIKASKSLAYNNYPVLINPTIALTGPDGMVVQLMDYSPHTVNSKVQSAGNQGISAGTSQGSNQSTTSGSSTSQSNSFGTSVSVGVSMNGPDANVSTSSDQSSSSSTDSSATTGTDSSSSSSKDSSSSTSMSIKDWGAYASVNPLTQCPSWAFGQEFPWSAFDSLVTSSAIVVGSQTQLCVPVTVAGTLYDGVFLRPPSELAMFGVNFVSKAVWLITLDDSSPSQITFNHTINYFSGTHNLNGTAANGVPQIFMDTTATVLNTIESPPIIAPGNGYTTSSITMLDLTLMSLDPIGLQKSAIVGFIPNKFITQPSALVPFEIISGANNLYIKQALPNATGNCSFSCSAENGLFATGQGDYMAISLYFKITDTINDYTLHMKHWKTSSAVSGVVLKMFINENFLELESNPAATVTKYMDELEAEGGDNNLTSVNLRNQDYASVNYHDYLQLGLNQITIIISGIDSTIPFGYQLRAISIEKD